jgi:hypothetical protein
MSLVLGYESAVGFRLTGIDIPDTATFTAQVRAGRPGLIIIEFTEGAS